ncbi:MAG: DUF2156 domain-containing protein [Bacteroidales bacterium]|nr:DUF2156 domain-containing protein [Bacteroidales bacterium]
MIEFKKIELSDKEWVDQLLQYSDYGATEFNFTVLFIWKEVFCTRIARYKDFLIVRFCPQGSSDTGKARYFFPAGRGNHKEVLEEMMQDARCLNAQFTLLSILEEQKAILEELFPDKFLFTPNRNSFDYIYLAENLITLKGKKYQSKRNFVSRFKKNNNWSYEEITPATAGECLQMNNEWCKLYGCGKDSSMQQESCSVKSALENFEALSLKGGILRVDGRIVAFSIGEKLNSNTFLVHIEKAFAYITGAYPAISQMFLQHQMSGTYSSEIELSADIIGFMYVNREDDAGDENLRNAKLQYHPDHLIEKYIATISEI